MRNTYKIFVEKGERPHGEPGCRGGRIMKVYLRETCYGGVDWIHLAEDRD
jgi:hypothetical protein